MNIFPGAVLFVPLSQGKVSVMDFADRAVLAGFKWSAFRARRGYYVVRADRGSRFKRVLVLLHREILGAPSNLQVDHLDGNGLNNQRYNLRLVTNAENGQAFCSKALHTTSRFRGVSFNRARGKWEVKIMKNGRRKYLGRFTSEEDAARARDKAALELFGKFAHLNLP